MGAAKHRNIRKRTDGALLPMLLCFQHIHASGNAPYFLGDEHGLRKVVRRRDQPHRTPCRTARLQHARAAWIPVNHRQRGL